ncbi:haloalkane dehalogenase [Gammaproteobacteria bacterium]|nr:haloalkane dehalogenase [Gammaproteobacteria bacterium]
MGISSDFKYSKSFITVNGKNLAYVDSGEGDPIVFLHGNPTSSYLWRNIMPHLEGMGRLVAPDLIGMGDSDKLDNSGPGRYTFIEHAEYLYALLEELNLNNVTLVIHDWGSALGFNWAALNPEKVKSIVYMEAITGPIESWDDWPEQARNIFQLFRSDAGEELILEKNFFVERVFAGDVGMHRALEKQELDSYVKPFEKEGESRRPTLTWPRQIPIEGEPAEVVEIAKNYAQFMSETQLPKLFINADPGSILIGKQRELARKWPNQKEVTVRGGHFIQEISPDEIGKSIKEFLIGLKG